MLDTFQDTYKTGIKAERVEGSGDRTGLGRFVTLLHNTVSNLHRIKNSNVTCQYYQNCNTVVHTVLT